MTTDFGKTSGRCLRSESCTHLDSIKKFYDLPESSDSKDKCYLFNLKRLANRDLARTSRDYKEFIDEGKYLAVDVEAIDDEPIIVCTFDGEHHEFFGRHDASELSHYMRDFKTVGFGTDNDKRWLRKMGIGHEPVDLQKEFGEWGPELKALSLVDASYMFCTREKKMRKTGWIKRLDREILVNCARDTRIIFELAHRWHTGVGPVLPKIHICNFCHKSSELKGFCSKSCLTMSELSLSRGIKFKKRDCVEKYNIISEYLMSGEKTTHDLPDLGRILIMLEDKMVECDVPFEKQLWEDYL